MLHSPNNFVVDLCFCLKHTCLRLSTTTFAIRRVITFNCWQSSPELNLHNALSVLLSETELPVSRAASRWTRAIRGQPVVFVLQSKTDLPHQCFCQKHNSTYLEAATKIQSNQRLLLILDQSSAPIFCQSVLLSEAHLYVPRDGPQVTTTTARAPNFVLSVLLSESELYVP